MFKHTKKYLKSRIIRKKIKPNKRKENLIEIFTKKVKRDPMLIVSRKALNLCYQTQLYWKRQRAFNKLFNWNDAEKIEETIKYPFRNWKPTRKYLKALKLRNTFLLKDERNYFVEK